MSILRILLLLTVVIPAGCSSGEKQAAQLLETARFEEKQHNPDHAAQLYDEILKKHPSSAAAKEAGERLSELRRQKSP